MSKPVVLMDLDGVVIDLEPKWFSIYNERWGDNLDPRGNREWDLLKVVKPESGRDIYNILDMDGFFRDLPAYEGALDGLKTLTRFTDVVVLTSALDNPNAAKDKLLWIREYAPFIKKGNVIITPRKDLVHGDIMVDDSPNNLKKTLAKHKIVYDHPYNRKVKDAERVHNWDELIEAIRRYNNEAFT